MPDDNISQQPRQGKSLADYGYCFAFIAILFLVVVVGMFGYLILKDSDSGSPGGVVYISNSQDSGTTTEPVTQIDTGLTDPTDTGLSGNSTDSTEITESPTNSTEAEPTEVKEEPVLEAPVDEFKGQIEFGKPSAEFSF